ncbi:TnpV protein [Dielma fastidiosa]|uniref:TnpV protein n=1 Tax=Dielma fastidiosa TaxID=1034346 RepID=A0AB35UNT3_9FIRM|nr:TnpV protein [Dielma fastidiosa]MDY5167779.1 TnpV protein [Dielma fastidiosa]
MLSGTLHQYFADIDSQARTRMEVFIKQFAEQDGITENLKKENQMAWIRAMNNVRNRAEEVVNAEIIYI